MKTTLKIFIVLLGFISIIGSSSNSNNTNNNNTEDIGIAEVEVQEILENKILGVAGTYEVIKLRVYEANTKNILQKLDEDLGRWSWIIGYNENVVIQEINTPWINESYTSRYSHDKLKTFIYDDILTIEATDINIYEEGLCDVKIKLRRIDDIVSQDYFNQIFICNPRRFK